MGFNVITSIMGPRASFVYIFILTIVPDSRCTSTSTVCFGVFGFPCTTHTLSCTSPLVIQIINTSYGYRPGCNNGAGLSDCTNTACCNEEPGDCFIPFSEEDQQVVGNCSGVETCTISGFREVSGKECGGTASAYSKIQYDCVSKLTSVFTCPTTEPLQFQLPPTDNSGIIGGVLGSLLIISIIINVGLVVYFTRKKSSSANSPVENTYDGLTITEGAQPTYEAVHVQSAASSDHDNRNESNDRLPIHNTIPGAHSQK